MPHVNLVSTYPGITGLLQDYPESGAPIRDLTQFLLRGPNTLTEGERELIASVVCVGNECQFCSNAHVVTAARYVGSVEAVHNVLQNPFGGQVDDRIAHLLRISAAVRTGGIVPDDMVEDARKAGATDVELHDTVLIAALFSLYNRYVDGLATDLPQDSSYYDALADRLTTTGYASPGQQHATH
ncbi:MAG: carboxymuconolactone decarboxylase [Candidatus Kapabacteria bacterium]|nr:carboxymuconolactone decarboxylase [Candidatus Kapabacteria bacterium]